jgi:putative PIN family toxin of toxin-antitoxin system
VRRLVVDPGVLVSAFISPRKSAPSIVVEAIFDRRIDILICPALIAELTDVLSREKFARYTTQERAEDYIASISQHAEQLEDPPAGQQQTGDPDDDYLLALAHSQSADAVVSGDKDLLDAADERMRMLTPRELVDELKLADGDAKLSPADQEPAPADPESAG